METNRELFEAYCKDVYRTCYYMVHDAADAEDLCQDIFITVFRSNWQEVEYIKAWIMRIAVNHCMNHLRRRRSLLYKVLGNPYLFMGTESKPVDRLIEERETAGEMADYMSLLPVKMRAVLTLRYIHDFSLSEISTLLSIPLGTTKSRLHKGLRLMKKILTEAGNTEEAEEGIFYEKNRGYSGTSIK